MSTPLDSALHGTAEVMSDTDESRNAETIENAKATFTLVDNFIEEIAPNAKRYAMSITRRWSDAEEVVQEAFCRMIQNQTVDSEQRAKATLYTIVRNLALDVVRTKKRRSFKPIDTEQLPNTSKTDDQRLEKLEHHVEEALNSMPENWSDAIRLKINGKLSYAEISAVLGATHAQVRTWIYRARKQLETELRQHGLLGGEIG